MADITNAPYASWLEQELKGILEGNASKIAILWENKEGEHCTSFYDCYTSDLLAFAGRLHYEAFLQNIEIDPERLRDILKGDPEDDRN